MGMKNHNQLHLAVEATRSLKCSEYACEEAVSTPFYGTDSKQFVENAKAAGWTCWNQDDLFLAVCPGCSKEDAHTDEDLDTAIMDTQYAGDV